MPLQENLGGEVGNWVLSGGGAFTVARVPMGTRHLWSVEGVVEAAEEVVGEELLCGAELVVGSAGWGKNRRRLLRVRCSQRKMMMGGIPLSSSLAGAVGRFLVQEGRGDEALLLVRSDSPEAARRWMPTVGEAAAAAEQSSEECVQTVGGRSAVGGSFLGDI
jgi:hypothetical protein